MSINSKYAIFTHFFIHSCTHSLVPFFNNSVEFRMCKCQKTHQWNAMTTQKHFCKQWKVIIKVDTTTEEKIEKGWNRVEACTWNESVSQNIYLQRFTINIFYIKRMIEWEKWIQWQLNGYNVITLQMMNQQIDVFYIYDVMKPTD